MIVGTQLGRLEPWRNTTTKSVVKGRVHTQLTIPEEQGSPWQGGSGRELRAHLQPQTGNGESKLVEHTVCPERHPLLTPPPTYPHQCLQLGPGIKCLNSWGEGVHLSFKPPQRELFQTFDTLNDFYNEIYQQHFYRLSD